MKNATNVEEASNVWLTEYEKPADIPGQKPVRAKAAQAYYDKFANWDGSGVTIDGSNYNSYNSNGKGNALLKGLNTALTGASKVLSFVPIGGGATGAAAKALLTVGSAALNKAGTTDLTKVSDEDMKNKQVILSTDATGATPSDGMYNVNDPNAQDQGENGRSVSAQVLDTVSGVTSTVGNVLGLIDGGTISNVLKATSFISGVTADVFDDELKELEDAVSSFFGGSAINTSQIGSAEAGKKLEAVMEGKYGTQAYYNENAGSLIDSAIKYKTPYTGNSSSSSYSGGSYVSSDDYSEESDTSSTIVVAKTDPNYYDAYNSAVTSQMKANWKKTLDDGMKEWSTVTRYGKAPENWWNKYLTNQRIADYYRTEYPQSRVNQAFSTWYQNKFYKSTAQKNKETLDNITNARLLANKIAYVDDPHEMAAIVQQYPQWAEDSRVKQRFTEHGYDKVYNDLLTTIKATTWDTEKSLTESGAWNTVVKARNLSGNGDVSTVTVPPVDIDKINAMMDTDMGTDTTSTTVNQYYVARDNNTDAWIDKLNSITFNVSAKKVESLLETIIEKMDSVGSGSTTTIIPKQESKAEDNHIPEQITVLARG